MLDKKTTLEIHQLLEHEKQKQLYYQLHGYAYYENDEKVNNRMTISDNAHQHQTPQMTSTDNKTQLQFKRGNLQLWQFLVYLLDERQNTQIIQWVNKQQCTFKLCDPEEVARQWGAQKNRQTMNYDKLSRSLRYYYEKGIMQKVNGERYVYKFMCNTNLNFTDANITSVCELTRSTGEQQQQQQRTKTLKQKNQQRPSKLKVQQQQQQQIFKQNNRYTPYSHHHQNSPPDYYSSTSGQYQVKQERNDDYFDYQQNIIQSNYYSSPLALATSDLTTRQAASTPTTTHLSTTAATTTTTTQAEFNLQYQNAFHIHHYHLYSSAQQPTVQPATPPTQPPQSNYFLQNYYGSQNQYGDSVASAAAAASTTLTIGNNPYYNQIAQHSYKANNNSYLVSPASTSSSSSFQPDLSSASSTYFNDSLNGQSQAQHFNDVWY